MESVLRFDEIERSGARSGGGGERRHLEAAGSRPAAPEHQLARYRSPIGQLH